MPNISTGVSQTLNDLAELTLIASDASYFVNLPPVGAVLAPLNDTPYGTQTPAYDYGTASNFTVAANPDPTSGGGVFASSNSATGGEYVVYLNQAGTQAIVAFGGSDGPDVKDWSQNQSLGWVQWQKMKAQLFSGLTTLAADHPGLTINFTGQSLGGALAQYAIYDWVKDNPGFSKSNLTLTTFNGLGGLWALSTFDGYQASLLDGIGPSGNFYVANDLVAQLGGITGTIGTHVGAPEYLLNFRDSLNPKYTLDLVAAHRIETAFYPNLGPLDPFTFAQPASIKPLNISSIQSVAALMGNTLNQADLNLVNATLNVVGATMTAFTVSTQSDADALFKALIENRHNSGDLSDFKYFIYKSIDWGKVTEPLRVGTLAAATVSLIGAVVIDALGLAGDAVAQAFQTIRDYFADPVPVNGDIIVPPAVSSDDRALQIAMAFPDAIPPSLGAADFSALLTAAGASQTQAAFDTYVGDLISAPASGQDWLVNAADFLRQQANAEGENDATFATHLSSDIMTLAKSVPDAQPDFLASTKQDVTTFLIDTAKGMGNAAPVQPTTPATSTFDLGQTLSFPDYDKLVKVFEGALNDPTVDGDIKLAINQARDIVEAAGEDIVLGVGDAANPFDAPGFDPSTAPPASVNLTQNGGQTLTLSLPYASGQSGEKIALQLQGNEAGDFRFLTSEGELTPDANGIVNITVPEGEQQYTFNLLANNDATTNSSLTLSATPLDQNGQPAGTTRVEATIQLTATSQTNSFPTLSYPIVNGVTSVPGFGGFGADTDFPGGSINGIVDGTGNVNYTIVAPAAEWDLETAAGNDSITGSNTQSFIGSGGGNDTVYGGDGGNLIVGDYIDDGSASNSRTGALSDGQDYLVGGAGFDLIGGGGGNDVLLGGGGNDNLIGDVMVETQYGFANTVGVLHPGNDFLDGGAGNDTLSGNGGDDTLFGGTGDDILYGDTHPKVNAQLLYPQASGNDFLDGGSGNDSLAGGGGNDTILGGDGNDVIDGDTGNDVLVGGSGSDIYRFQIGDGQDTIIDTAPAGEINTIMFETGITDLTFTPDPVAHTLVIAYDNVGDTITLKNFDPNGVFGTSVIQNIIVGDWNPGDPFAEQNIPSPFVPVGQTFSLRDLLGPIDGFVDGTNANNTFANNTITTGPAADFIEGGPGGMTLDAGAGNDTVVGGNGNDTIHGRSGNNQLFGGTGNDLIYGEGASDTVDGGAGNDTLVGTGGGTYTYLFGPGGGEDVIDGSQGGTYLIQLSGSVDPKDVTFGQSGSDLIMALPGGQDSLTLKSINGNASLIDFPDGSTKLLSGQNAIPIPTTTTTLIAQSANDTSITGDALGDLIIGGQGSDVLNGGIGNDVIIGGAGDDVIGGDTGNDVLIGGAGDDYIIGTSFGLRGGSDNDYLDGGTGNDVLGDASGSNTYVFGRGYGHDVISNINDNLEQGDDTLKLVNILPGDITIQQYDPSHFYPLHFGDISDLEILVNGTSDSFLLLGWIEWRDSATVYNPEFTINQIQFADGTTWSTTDLVSHAQGVSLTGTDADDRLDGTAFNDVLTGGAGDDVLDGMKGNDILDGGAGNDELDGGLGSDTYIFGKGYGADQIYEDNLFGPDRLDETNVIQLNADVTPQEVTLQADPGGDLVLGISGTQDSVTVNHFFENVAYQIQEISFADGTVWDLNAILAKATGMQITGTYSDDVLTGTPLGDVLLGLGGADTLDGAGGNDLLRGGPGDDTYLFRIGSGRATIEDTAAANELNRVRFDSGVSASDLVVSQNPGVLTLALDGTADQIQLTGFDPTGVSGSLVAGILDFSNGFQISTAGLVAAPQYTNGADSITGTASNDILLGGAGDDTLTGGIGNDTLIGGPGNDTYRFNLGDGVDSIDDRRTDQNRLVFGPGITLDQIHRQLQGSILQGSILTLQVGDTGDAVKIAGFTSNMFNDQTVPFGISQFEFADGTVETSAQLLAGGYDVLGTDANDTLYGLSFDDRLFGGKGDDLLIGGPGADTYVFNIGDGHDTIDDYNYNNIPNQVNTIRFGQGISESDLTFLRDGFDLLIDVGTNGDAISLTYFGLGYKTAQTLEFADGTSINITNILNTPLGTTASETITGTAGDDVIFGGGGIDALFGGQGNDTLVGGSGNTQFNGGAGNNVLVGGKGSNTYFINEFSSINRIILPNSIPPGTTNTVAFASGYDNANPWLSVGSLDIHYGTTGGELIIEGFDPDNAEKNPGIDFFQFTDRTLTYDQFLALGFDLSATGAGEVVNGTSVTDRLTGLPGNDTLIGGAGDDTFTGAAGDVLIGGSGNDTYNFNLGDGREIIQDTSSAAEGNRIQFGTGIRQSDLTFTHDATARTLTIQVGANGTNQLILSNFDATGTNGSLVASTLAFADGTTANLADLVPADVNHAPAVANPLADRSVPEDTPFTIQVPANTFADPDAGDTLTYSATQADGTALPSWLSFNAATRTFTGTPDDAQVGTLNLAVKATDSGGLSASSAFALTVQNVNEAPVVANPLANQTVLEDAPLTIQVPANTFADPDAGDTLTYSATLANGNPLPAWLTFNGNTRTFSGTPGSADAGLLSLKVTATDTGSLTAADVFNLTVSSPDQTLIGTAGNDVLTGGVGNDTLSGLAGNDTLIGAAGNDLLDGGTGADSMGGGPGNDTYVVDNTGDVVTENVNEGTDTVQSSITYTLGANVENLTLTGTAAINGTGNALNNVLIGNSANNVLTGGAGNDRLDGGLGSDTMIGGTGDDTYVVNQAGDVVTENLNEGTDTVESSINYILGSNLENLTLTGTANLAGTGNTLNNVMIGNSGANAMDGGSGNDSLDGGAGNDSLQGGSGDDTVIGGLGDDVLSGGSGNDVLDGGDGADSLDGGSGDDTLRGGAGNDQLVGGSGADQFTGGTGNDTLTGGSGNDVYNFSRGDGQDTIIDSDPFSGNQDHAVFGATINPLDLVISRQANDLRLAIHGSTDSITIQNWYTSPNTNQIEDIQAGNGQHLANTQVDQLIQAMASFSQQTGLTWDQAIDQRPQDVQTVLAASWH